MKSCCGFLFGCAHTHTHTCIVSPNKAILSRKAVLLHADPTTEEKVDTSFSTPAAPTRPFIERGVSVDQDGQSNVWALEPKVEIENKSNEEKTQNALFAAGGLAVCVVAAAAILANLPDPDQF